MKAIFNREFKSYFTSMIGPVFVAARDRYLLYGV